MFLREELRVTLTQQLPLPSLPVTRSGMSTTQQPHSLTTDVAGSIGWLTIDRPSSRGALTAQMWEALPATLEALAAAPGVRVVIIRGSQGNFIAGADINEFAKLRSNPELARVYDRGANATLESLARLAVPSIAQIGGACVGGGCLIAFGCDLRVMSASAAIGIPAAKLGLAYPCAALERLAAVIGEAEALALTLTGRLLDGREAHQRGLVQFCVEEGSVEAKTLELAEHIASGAPLSLRYLRQALRRRPPAMLSAQEINQLADACFESADYREGIEAFLNKRQPVFSGR